MIENRKKLIRLIIVLLPIVALAYVCVTFRLITVSSSTPVSVFINDSRNKTIKQITLDNSRSISIVKNGSYSINAVHEDKQSIYETTTNFFSLNTVAIELTDQQNSTFIGDSSLACSNNSTTPPVFYSCNPSTLAAIHTSEPTNALPKQISDDNPNVSQVLKPYMGNFLTVFAEGNSITLTLRSRIGEEIKKTQLTIEDFEALLSDNTVSTSQDSSSFAFFDKENARIIKFNNIDDPQPEMLSIDKNDIDTDHNESRLIVGNNYTYLLSFTTELHSHEGEGSIEHEQKLFVFEGSTLKKQTSLPSDWFLNRISDSQNNQFLLSTLVEEGNEIYLIGMDGKPQRILVGTNNYQDLCWKDNATFYYVSDQGKTIYSYSLTNKVSRLVYDGLLDGSSITSIACSGGVVTFTLNGSKENMLTTYRHFSLTNGAFSGVRLEAALPLYFNTDNSNTLRATYEKNGITVRSVYGSPPEKDAAQQELYKELEQKGVKSKPSVQFNF